MTIYDKIALAKNIVESNKGKFITVDFLKKDGKIRHMVCHRSKVLESSIIGNKPEATAKRKQTLSINGMLGVEEMKSDKTFQFRTINLATVQRIAANGVVYDFTKRNS